MGSLIDLAFERLGARRVEALTDELNAASRSLCIGFGMHLEGILRNERVGDGGELRNTCVFAAVR